MAKRKTKATNAELVAAYKELKSVWKVGKLFGMCGQSVHERIKKFGVKTTNPRFSNHEKEILKNEYLKYRDSGELSILADRFGRTKQFICRKAKELGLTDRKRPKHFNIGMRGRCTPKEIHPNWKGGVTDKNIPLFDTYAKQVEYMENVRRSPEMPSILQVKCAYCGAWMTPSLTAVSNRINGANKGNAGNRFYCSEMCKVNCPTYKKIKYPAGFKKATSREVVPELRRLVFERDSWMCQMCSSLENLHCHHVKGYAQNKMLANDPDNCITLCKDCHEAVHKKNGCRGVDLSCVANIQKKYIEVNGVPRWDISIKEV